jgi:hypothetical protein
MGDVTAGLYEHLVTGRLNSDLNNLPPNLTQFGVLDPADAHETLTRHIAELANRALRAAGGSDGASISRQVELANRIVAAIGHLVPSQATFARLMVSARRMILRSLGSVMCRFRQAM